MQKYNDHGSFNFFFFKLLYIYNCKIEHFIYIEWQRLYGVASRKTEAGLQLEKYKKYN